MPRRPLIWNIKQSFIITFNVFYRIDIFEEYSSLQLHLLFILIEHSSL